MKNHLPRLLLPLCLLACSCVAHAQTRNAPPDAEAPLTNAAVVKLVRAGFSEKSGIAIIRVRPVRLELAPDHRIELKQRGGREKIILAMLARDGAALPRGDASRDGFR